jgi:twinkle protein
MSSEGLEYPQQTEPANRGPYAPNAPTCGERNGTDAWRCGSMLMVRDTTAGTVDSPGGSRKISAAAEEWAAARGLSVPTLECLGVASGTVFFPDAGQKLDAVFFQYADGWKARSIEGKRFVAGKGFKGSFWNLERVLGQSEVFIVEGELDACALVEAGVPVDRVLSVPNGAKERPADAPQEQRGYDYVREALAAGLSKAKRFVWCGDTDGPGLALRADMARLLGIARFWFVDWPEGCKDAGDLLRTDGPQALHDLVTEGALQWPVEGLYRLNEMPEPPPLVLWDPGFAEWESKVKLAPRTLSVVTGHPGHGKTAMWQQIWFQVVHRYGVPACMASFETRAKPHIRRQLRTLLAGRLEHDMTEQEKAQADAWISDRYVFLSHPDQRPTLDWFLDMAEVAVVRHGARIIQLDPWNRLEASRGRDESETEYIGRCLRSLHTFANDMNCHVQILAHPAKMDSARRGSAPGLEDISGSKNWENMVDQGFVVHRPTIFDGVERKTEAALYHRKARFEELGHPCKLAMNYQLTNGRYVSTDYAVGY